MISRSWHHCPTEFRSTGHEVIYEFGGDPQTVLPCRSTRTGLHFCGARFFYSLRRFLEGMLWHAFLLTLHNSKVSRNRFIEVELNSRLYVMLGSMTGVD